MWFSLTFDYNTLASFERRKKNNKDTSVLNTHLIIVAIAIPRMYRLPLKPIWGSKTRTYDELKKKRSHDHYEIRLRSDVEMWADLAHQEPQFVIILIWGITFSLYCARFAEFDHFEMISH